MFAGVKPRSTFTSRAKLCTSRPAPTSSTSASETSAATSELRESAPLPPVRCSRRTPCALWRRTCTAGALPNREGGQYDEPGGKSEEPSVERDLRGARHVPRHQPDDRVERPRGEQQTPRPTRAATTALSVGSWRSRRPRPRRPASGRTPMRAALLAPASCALP